MFKKKFKKYFVLRNDSSGQNKHVYELWNDLNLINCNYLNTLLTVIVLFRIRFYQATLFHSFGASSIIILDQKLPTSKF